MFGHVLATVANTSDKSMSTRIVGLVSVAMLAAGTAWGVFSKPRSKPLGIASTPIRVAAVVMFTALAALSITAGAVDLSGAADQSGSDRAQGIVRVITDALLIVFAGLLLIGNAKVIRKLRRGRAPGDPGNGHGQVPPPAAT